MTEKDVQIVSNKIDEEKDNLDKLSMEIWNNPELRHKEVHAHSVLTEALEKYGFSVQKNYLLDTAFRAEYSSGSEGPVVAVMCEYDALPEIGHACGHNLIAESGVAAAIGMKVAIESDNAIKGKIVVIGCPGEEGGAGKVRLLEKGAFEGIDVALMVHPANISYAAAPYLCIVRVEVTYKGKEAHASAYPWEGKNALDAAVSAYVNIGLLRQHIKPMCRIHGIITNGGTAPNVIPGETKLVFCIRAPDLSELSALKPRVKSCFVSAAEATGCEVEINFADSDAYYNVIANKVLISLFRGYSKELGMEYLDDNPDALKYYPTTAGSTDMGNVSYVIPSIHPVYNIGVHMNHTKDFAEQSKTASAHEVTRTAGKALALTGIRLMRSPETLKATKDVFQEDIKLNER